MMSTVGIMIDLMQIHINDVLFLTVIYFSPGEASPIYMVRAMHHSKLLLHTTGRVGLQFFRFYLHVWISPTGYLFLLCFHPLRDLQSECT